MAFRDTIGEVITFYSYKGGTGRTMALANIACLLSNRLAAGKGVLMVDWDLEAPSLHRFFCDHFQKRFADSPNIEKALNEHPGLIELFEIMDQSTPQTRDGKPQNEEKVVELLASLPLEDYILSTDIPSLYLLKAGRFDETYSYRVNEFQWKKLFERSPWLYRCFAERLAQDYDYVLIDSRTGSSDIGSICTMYMPERLVMVFTPNRQSLTGVLKLVHRATSFRQKSDDLRPLIVFPLVSRVDAAEVSLLRRWRYGDSKRGIVGFQPQFEQLFKEVYSLSECSLEAYFDEVMIQHIPEYAYGEEIAVLVEEMNCRFSLTRSYENFCERLVNLNGPWEELDQIKEHIRFDEQKRIRAIKITADGLHAISTSADHTLRLWDLKSGKELRTLKGHTDEVRAVALTKDGRQAISASFDATIKVWDLNSGEILRTLRGHKDGDIQGGARVRTVALTPDEQWVISGSADHTLKIWDLTHGKKLRTLLGHDGLVNAVVVTCGGLRAISASDDKTLKVWDLKSGEELQTLRGHEDFVLAVTLIGNGRSLISASFDQTLKVWDIESGKELHTLKGHTREVRDVAVTTDGRYAISASYDQTVKVWDLQTYAVIETFNGEHSFTACDVSPDGHTIVAGDVRGNVHFLRLPNL